jgi:hypothetical protein
MGPSKEWWWLEPAARIAPLPRLAIYNIVNSMRSIGNIKKKRRRGRPETNATPVMVRVHPDQLAALDAWIERQPDPKPSRPEAIRRILAEGLDRPRWPRRMM